VIPVASQGRMLARNTVLNLLGQVLPAVAAVLFLPYTLHGLGVTRFGILSLAWTLLGYLSLFDLGLGRATIRYVSDALGRHQRYLIPSVVWTSMATQLISGSVGCVALILATPYLVPAVIKVPAPLVGEARAVLVLLAIALPVLICSSAAKGVLEAHQRFDLVNVVRSVSGTLLFAIPAAGIFVGFGLQGIMLAIDASLVLVAGTYFVMDLFVAPELRRSVRIDRRMFRQLVSFGGWVTVSSLVVPLLVYADRLLLSAIASVAVLAYYTVPYELTSRLQVIPWSFGTALFPALSARSASTPAEIPMLYSRSIKFLFVVMSPLSLAALVGAHPVLQVWLGASFAARSSVVMQLLAVGMLLNALAQMPAQVLDAVGRPDLRAKTFLAYAPLYLVLVWVLIANLGTVGAATGWTLRSLLELCLFFGVAWRLRGLGLKPLVRNRTVAGLVAFVVVALAGYFTAEMVRGNVWLGLAVGAAFLLAYSAMLGIAILDRSERAQLWTMVRDLLDRPARSVGVRHESSI
jgi:O-antigen/teichoic acid export membrane protein